jgi:hypothetical protein
VIGKDDPLTFGNHAVYIALQNWGDNETHRRAAAWTTREAFMPVVPANAGIQQPMSQKVKAGRRLYWITRFRG